MIKPKQIIDFTKNWNHKLLCDVFTTIRPISKKYKLNEIFDIRIDDRHFCYAELIDKRENNLGIIIQQNIHLTDTGLNQLKFMELMSRFYSDKKWWQKEETNMQILYLKKITQLDIFDIIDERI